MKTKLKIILNTVSITLLLLSFTLFFTYLLYTLDLKSRLLSLHRETVKFILTLIDERVQALEMEAATGRIVTPDDASLYRDIVESVTDYFDLESHVNILVFHAPSEEVIYPFSGKGRSVPSEILSGTRDRIEGELDLSDRFGYFVRYGEPPLIIYVFSRTTEVFMHRNQLLYIIVGLMVLFTLFILLSQGKILQQWHGFLSDMNIRFVEVVQGKRNVPDKLGDRYGSETDEFLRWYNSMVEKVGSVLKHLEEKLRDLFKQRDNLKKIIFLYKKYIPYKKLLKLTENEATDAVSKRTDVSSLSIELLNFLEPTDELYPQVITKELNDFQAYIKDEVVKAHGIINFSKGYFLNVIYGVPYQDEKSFIHAASGAKEILQWVEERNRSDRNISGIKWTLKLGLTYGAAVTGIVGDSYIVLGDAVEKSGRMLEYAKYFNVPLITENVSMLKTIPDVRYRKLDIIRDIDSVDPTDGGIYEIFLRDADMIDQAIKIYNHGLEMFYEERYEMAVVDFKKVNNIFNGDSPSQIFLNRCEQKLKGS